MRFSTVSSYYSQNSPLGKHKDGTSPFQAGRCAWQQASVKCRRPKSGRYRRVIILRRKKFVRRKRPWLSITPPRNHKNEHPLVAATNKSISCSTPSSPHGDAPVAESSDTAKAFPPKNGYRRTKNSMRAKSLFSKKLGAITAKELDNGIYGSKSTASTGQYGKAGVYKQYTV